MNPSSDADERHYEQAEPNAAMKENRGKFQDVQSLSVIDQGYRHDHPFA
jgi:hypothetical protein